MGGNDGGRRLTYAGRRLTYPGRRLTYSGRRQTAGDGARRAGAARIVPLSFYRSRIFVNPRFASAACSAWRLSSHDLVILRFSSSDNASDRTFVLRRESVMIWVLRSVNLSSAAVAVLSWPCAEGGSSVRSWSSAFLAADSEVAISFSIRVITASSASAMCGAC